MNNRLIRLTESDLHRIVKESVKKIIKEAADHKYGGETLNADNAADLITLYHLKHRKAEDASNYEDRKRHFSQGNEYRERGIRKGIGDYDMFNKGEEKANRIIPKTRPQRAIQVGQKLKDMLFDAIKKCGDTGKIIDFQYSPSDGFRRVMRDWGDDSISKALWDSMDYKYREKVLGFKPHIYNGGVHFYEPYFDEETQKQWVEEKNKYQQKVSDYYASKKSGEYVGD